MERKALEYESDNAFMQSYLKTALLAGFKVVDSTANIQKELTPFEQALDDVKCGRVTRIKTVSNLLEECMQWKSQKFKALLQKYDDNCRDARPCVSTGGASGKSDYRIVRIHLTEGKPVMTLLSMKALEEKLPSRQFMRVHRSFIVNQNRINLIERNRIIFDKDVYIPIGDQYKEAFQQFLEKDFLHT